MRDRDTPIGGAAAGRHHQPGRVDDRARGRRDGGGTVNVTANASDDTAVSGVQFKLDGANLGAEDTSAPYSARGTRARRATPATR